MTAPFHIVVMGPSGSGKTAVGSALAVRLGVDFVDADDLHPAANVKKMTAGTPLSDDDRRPWLELVGKSLAESQGLVVACSALARRYRDQIRAVAKGTRFVELVVARDELDKRMQMRSHFMPPSLLDSQLATLEPLVHDEPGVRLPNTTRLADVAEHAYTALTARSPQATQQ